MADTMEDTEFKAFCAELKSETPDMSKIRAGMEKYGLGQLSDAQKEAFLAALFPAPIAKGAKEAEKLGFQNLNGIKNALSAMQELHKEGKIGDDAMLQFLTEPNPKTGRNAMTTVALNTVAADSKSKKIKDPEAKELLYQKTQNMVDIQTLLGKLPPEILAKAANTPDKTKGVDGAQARQINYRNLAGLSFMMKDNLERIQPYLAQLDAANKLKSHLATQPENESTQTPLGISPVMEEQAETFKIGGNTNAPLTIDGTQQAPLNINTQNPSENPNEEEKPDKVATLDNAGPDSDKGKNDWHITPVEQQDIIDYMFKTFVIGGMNLGLEYSFKGVEYLLSPLVSRSDKPKMSESASAGNSGQGAEQGSGGAGQNTPGAGGQGRSAAEGDNLSPSQKSAAYIDRIRELGAQSAQAYGAFLNDKNNPDYLNALILTVEQNIGKEPDKWKPVHLAGEKEAPKILFNPATHTEFIKQLNAIYQTDPAKFKQLTETAKKKTLKGIKPKDMETFIAGAAQLAAVEHAAKFLDDPLDDKAAHKVRLNTLGKMEELLETWQQIQQKNTLEILKDPTKQPTPKEQKKIEKATQKEYEKYMKDVGNSAAGLRDLLGAHHAETDPAKKLALSAQIKATQEAYHAIYDQYRNPQQKEETRTQPDERHSPLPGPVDLRNAADFENKTDNLNQQFKDMILNGVNSLDDQRSSHNERQQNFVMRRDKILENEPAQAPNMQTFLNNVLKQKQGRS